MQHSESIDALVGALTEAQKDFKPVIPDKINPFFKSKYADLADCINATKSALLKNGLTVIQGVQSWDGSAGCTTLLAHSSGQWMRTETMLPVDKLDPQGAGSAFTYARRYAYSAMLGLAPDEDTDGNDHIASKTSSDAPRSSREEIQVVDDPSEFVMPMGKHEGKKLSDVPQDYLEWIVNESKAKDHVKQAAYDYLIVLQQDAIENDVKTILDPTQADIDFGGSDGIPF